MMTPFDIRERVEKINFKRQNLRTYDAVSRARLARDVFNLYRDILHEVARGSLDARSLAIAGIKVEKK